MSIWRHSHPPEKILISAIRTLLCLLSFFLSWSLLIGILIYAASLLIHGCDLWLAPLWNKMIIFGLGVLPAASFKLSAMLYHYPPHPIFNHIATVSIGTGGIIVVLHLLWQWLSPIERDVLAAAKGFSVGRITQGSDIDLAVAQMAIEAGIRKPKLYEIQSQAINALAIRKPFRSAIAVYTGATDLPAGCLLWIIGHEMGHLKYGDTAPTMLRIATGATSIFFFNLRARILNLLFPVLVRIPVIRIFVVPFEMLLMALFYCALTAHRFAATGFTLIDRACLRAIEYRADAFASTLMDAEYGIQLMEWLEINEGRSTLMQDHPSARKRAARLKAI